MLNDPVFQEAAEALTKRVLRETQGTIPADATPESALDARLAYESRLVLSRDATPRELEVLRSFFGKALAMANGPRVVPASIKLSSSHGVSPGELKALTAVGSVLFNLDAALTR